MSPRKSEFARIVDEHNEIRAVLELREKANRSPWRKIGDFFGSVVDWLDDNSRGIMLLIATVPLIFGVGAITLITINLMMTADIQTVEPKIEALPESTPVVAPDLSGFWNIAGVAGAIVGLGLLITGLVFAIAKTRSVRRDLEERRSAAAAERLKALAIWNRSVDLHRGLSAKALSIETDWNMIFSYPALLDSSIPATRDFHRLLKIADGLSPEAPAHISLSTDIPSLPYPKAVTQADSAWTAAWSFAQRTGLKLIPRAERKKLDQIERLLKLARSGGSEHERSVAYGRVAKLIGELQFVKAPEAALKSIDSHRRAMIEAPAGAATGAVNRQAERVFAA